MRKAPALLATALWLVSLGGPVACSTTVSQEEVTKREMDEARDDPGAYVEESSAEASEEEVFGDMIDDSER